MAAELNRPAPGAGVTATWNYTLWTIVTLFVVIDLLLLWELMWRFTATRNPATMVLVLLSLLAAASRLRVCWLLRDAPAGDAHNRWPTTLQTVLLLAPAVASWLFAFAGTETAPFAAAQLWLSGVLLTCFAVGRARWGMLALVLVVTALPVLLLAGGITPAWGLLSWPQTFLLVLYGSMMPAMLYTSLWMWKVVRTLDDARRLAAELAVTQERLRFAADLHDIQGHHLQVIALKAELAERTLERFPAQAAAQIGEIRLIAKEAMEETRSLVAGLRAVGLRDELENASEVLTLAGAQCALEIDGTPQDPAAERVLAFVVREATTNVLRHSAATHATISLGPARDGYELVITNDGVEQPAANTLSGPGSGLAGLRERVAAVGGTLHAGVAANAAVAGRAGAPGSSASEPPTTFELRVWVPGEKRT